MTAEKPTQLPNIKESSIETPSKILSVSELTFQIKSHLETRFRVISVQGEISNFKAQSSGHLYFSLKDKEAQISCVMFKGFTKTLQKVPKIGDQVILKGELSVYPPRGGYQLVVRELSFAGVGQLLLKLHALKEKLKQEGFFDPDRKKPIPPFPKKILVITSPTGAVIQDILNVIKRRAHSFHLQLYPVKVQGDEAPSEIAQAIKEANKYNLADVIIVGRGGGSMEDLWALNEEVVVKAIYDSKIPIITAWGHETDYTLSDLAADLRAPTPSAAAELVCKESAQILQNLTITKKRIIQSLLQKITVSKEKLNSVSRHPHFCQKEALLFAFIQKLDDTTQNIDQRIKQKIIERKIAFEGLKKQRFDPKNNLISSRQRLQGYSDQLKQSIRSKLDLFKSRCLTIANQKNLNNLITQKLLEKRKQIETLSALLSSVNPEKLLEKGYSILFRKKDDSIILSTDLIEKNEAIYARIKDGTIYATIDKVEKQNGK